VTPGSVLTNVYVIPIDRSSINGTTVKTVDDIIDTAGLKDSTQGLINWSRSLPAPKNATDVLTIVAPPGCRLRVNGDMTGFWWRNYMTFRSADNNNKARVTTDRSFPYRPRPNLTTNPNGEAATPWIDINDDEDNPSRFGWDGYCTNDSPAVAGHAAGLGVLHRNNGTFKTAQIGFTVEIWQMVANGGKASGTGKWQTGDTGQLFSITGLSADKKSAYLNGKVAASYAAPGHPQEDRFWAINPKGDWQRVFTPTGSVPPGNNWTGKDANGTAVDHAMGGYPSGGAMDDGARTTTFTGLNGDHQIWSNIDYLGPNVGWNNVIQQRANNDPCSNDSQDTIQMFGTNSRIESSDISHTWGCPIPLCGRYNWVYRNTIHHIGRQPMSMGGAIGTWGAVVEANVMHTCRRDFIDIEPNTFSAVDNGGYAHPALWNVDWVHIVGNVFGFGIGGVGKQGITGSAPAFPLAHILIENNHSTTADVTAGLIPHISPFNSASNFGPNVEPTLFAQQSAAHVSIQQRTASSGPAVGLVIRNNTTDDTMGESNSQPAGWHIRGWDLAWFQNNARGHAFTKNGGIAAGWLEIDPNPNYTIRAHATGNKSAGATDPNQYEGTAPPTFTTAPGAGGTGDWWYDAGCPYPPIPGRA
jgi:hypothetical protein